MLHGKAVDIHRSAVVDERITRSESNGQDIDLRIFWIEYGGWTQKFRMIIVVAICEKKPLALGRAKVGRSIGQGICAPMYDFVRTQSFCNK